MHAQTVCKWWIFNLCLGVTELGCNAGTGPGRAVDQLAFRNLSDGGLYLMNADGSGTAPIWRDSTGDVPMCPMWSPDGGSIAFHTFLGNQISVLSLATRKTRQLTSGPDWNQCPIWSPDGTQIAYLSGPSTAPNGYALYIMKADGTGQTRLGTGAFDADRGAWSPDGRWLLLSQFQNSHLVLVDAVSGAVGKELTSGPDRAPAWSRDGASIVFSRQVSEMVIFVMHADGSSLKQLTTPPSGSSDGYPTWSPTGQLIAFHRYTTSGPYPAPPLAALLLIDPQGTVVAWPDSLQHAGDLPVWRPRQ